MTLLRCPRISGLMPLATAALLVTLGAPSFASAQPAADRSELEEKKRLQEEKRRTIEKLKEEATRETEDQKESRLRAEAKVAKQQEALAKAKEALTAAARRQNRKGQDLMREAWMLDPGNMDYSFNTAAFAEANNDGEAEFWAYSAFTTLALNELVALGPSTSDYKTQIEERVAKARGRMDALRGKLSTGMVSLEVQPSDCELYLDGAYLGRGKGKIEALTGSRTVRTDCQGYKPLEQVLNVRGGDANTALLRPRSIDYYGYLIFNVKPADGVTVFLDDVDITKRVGAEPNADGVVTGTGSKKDPIHLHARKWIIRFYKPGYDRWHRRIEIRRGQITVVNAALEKMSDTVESSGNE
ncbi:MAG: hypothetical protein RIT45_1936 [Pseudomonadota bacterium]|jgi:hypothetical protein